MFHDFEFDIPYKALKKCLKKFIKAQPAARRPIYYKFLDELFKGGSLGTDASIHAKRESTVMNAVEGDAVKDNKPRSIQNDLIIQLMGMLIRMLSKRVNERMRTRRLSTPLGNIQFVPMEGMTPVEMGYNLTQPMDNDCNFKFHYLGDDSVDHEKTLSGITCNAGDYSRFESGNRAYVNELFCSLIEFGIKQMLPNLSICMWRHYKQHFQVNIDKGVFTKRFFKQSITAMRCRLSTLLASGVPHTLMLNGLRNAFYFTAAVRQQHKAPLDNNLFKHSVNRMGVNIVRDEKDFYDVDFCSGVLMPVITPDTEYRGIPPNTETFAIQMPIERFVGRAIVHKSEVLQGNTKYPYQRKADYAYANFRTLVWGYRDMPIYSGILDFYGRHAEFTTGFEPAKEWSAYQSDYQPIRMGHNYYELLMNRIGMTMDAILGIENYYRNLSVIDNINNAVLIDDCPLVELLFEKFYGHSRSILSTETAIQIHYGVEDLNQYRPVGPKNISKTIVGQCRFIDLKVRGIPHLLVTRNNTTNTQLNMATVTQANLFPDIEALTVPDLDFGETGVSNKAELAASGQKMLNPFATAPTLRPVASTNACVIAKDLQSRNVAYATDINTGIPTSMAYTGGAGEHELYTSTAGNVALMSSAGSGLGGTTIATYSPPVLQNNGTGLPTVVSPHITIECNITIAPGTREFLSGRCRMPQLSTDILYHDFFKAANSAFAALQGTVIKGHSVGTTLSTTNFAVMRWRRKLIASRSILRPIIALSDGVATQYIDGNAPGQIIDMEEHLYYVMRGNFTAATFTQLFIGFTNSGNDVFSGALEVDLWFVPTSGLGFAGSISMLNTPAHHTIYPVTFASTWPVRGVTKTALAMINSCVEVLLQVSGTNAIVNLPRKTKPEDLQGTNNWFDTISNSIITNQRSVTPVATGAYGSALCCFNPLVFGPTDVQDDVESLLYIVQSPNSSAMYQQVAAHLQAVPYGSASKSYATTVCVPKLASHVVPTAMILSECTRVSCNPSHMRDAIGSALEWLMAYADVDDDGILNDVGDLVGIVSPRGEALIKELDKSEKKLVKMLHKVDNMNENKKKRSAGRKTAAQKERKKDKQAIAASRRQTGGNQRIRMNSTAPRSAKNRV